MANFRISSRWIKPIVSVFIFSFLFIFSAITIAQPRPGQKPFSLNASVFTGIRYNAFQYNAFYNNPETDGGLRYFQNFANSTFKDGYIAGGEIGIIRAFRHLYNLGLMISGVGSSEKAQLMTHVDSDDSNAESGWVDIVNKFSIKYQFDLAVMFGVKLTLKALMYAKIGPSYSSIDQNQTLSSYSDFASDYTYASYKNNKKRVGGVFGLGIKYFFTNRIGIFAEYDYYDYGKITLPTINPVNTDFVNAGNNTLTQSVKPQFGSLRFGLNVTLW